MATPPDPNKRKPKSTMPVSRKKAIEDKCKECVYDKKGEGTWREQVEGCCGYSCPLYPVRPLPTTRIKTVQVEGDES